MRIDKVAGKAMVVIAMALMAWFSPTSAEARAYGCNQWDCVEMVEYCDEVDVAHHCGIVCPGWDVIWCSREEPFCDAGQYGVYCQNLG